MAAMNKNIVIASVALLLDEEEQNIKKRRTRTIWTRPWVLRRNINGAFHAIFKELKEHDSDGFKGYVRMDVDQFEELVHLLSPVFTKAPFGEFDWIKEKMLQKIYSRCQDTWVFSCFLTYNIRFLLLKQKKFKSVRFFFCVSATKNFKKKVAKQRNLTWGHVETFVGNCNRFLLPSHKNCFRVPLA